MASWQGISQSGYTSPRTALSSRTPSHPSTTEVNPTSRNTEQINPQEEKAQSSSTSVLTCLSWQPNRTTKDIATDLECIVARFVPTCRDRTSRSSGDDPWSYTQLRHQRHLGVAKHVLPRQLSAPRHHHQMNALFYSKPRLFRNFIGGSNDRQTASEKKKHIIGL